MENKLSDYVESHSDHTNQNKPRRKRSKFSSVNSRLNPNFDPREILKPKHHETISEDVELDPRALEFERLVSMLHPTIILEYLKKILNFLSSSMIKMSFQNIALYKEVLLVRLCQEKSNLNCVAFSKEARKLALQIVELLKANQNVYEWTCKYERGIFCPDVLVYEKVYYNLRITIRNTSNDTGPPLRPIQSSNANGDSSTQDVQIKVADKAHMLNTLLKFIKDNTQLKLEYPHVHKSQATLLTSLINPDKATDTGEGFVCKSLYEPLYKAFNAYKIMYEFHIRFDEDSAETLLMTLQKVPKPTKIKLESPKQSSHGDHNNAISNASDNSQNADPNESSKLMKLKFVGDVMESFIGASLREVSEFMEDDSKASLHFEKVTHQECGFLSRILQYSRDARYYEQFPSENRALLGRIEAAGKNTQWKLAIEVGKTDKETRLKNVTMRKEPNYRHNSKPTATVAPQSKSGQTPTSSPRGTNIPSKAKPISFQSASAIDAENEPETENTAAPKVTDDVTKLHGCNSMKSRLLAAMSVPLECDKGERMMRLMGWQGGALGARGEGITEPLIPALHIAPGAGLGHTKQVQTTQNMIEFRVQFLNGILSFLRAGESETTLEYTEYLEKKKVRFVNRAIQNMKQWKDCGLKRPDEKRVLEEVFEEMKRQGKQVHSDVCRPDSRKLTLKKGPLMLHTTKVKKNRKYPKPTSYTQESTSKSPDSTSNASLSTSSNPVSSSSNPDSTPSYPDLTALNQNSPAVQNTESQNDCITETITRNQIIALRDIFKLDIKTKSLKNAETLAHKLVCMTKIYDFVQIDDERRRYTFECIPRKKLQNQLKSYVMNAVNNINKKVMPQFYSELEHEVYGDIRKTIPAGCLLTVVFEYPNFTLIKIVYRKRFINSTRDLPPPKSTDVNNTIIYQNNKIVSYNGVINVDDDDVNVDDDHVEVDDDVILIEKKIDVFEISDDEDNETEADPETVTSDTVSTFQTENSEKTEEKLTDIIIEDSSDGSLSIEFSQHLSASRETLLLEPLEEDFKVKTDIVDKELDSDIKELQQAIIDCDIMSDEMVMQSDDVKQNCETPEDISIDVGTETIEINNNDNDSLIAKNKPSLLVSDCVQTKDKCGDTVDVGINEKHALDTIFDILRIVRDTNDKTIEIKNEDQGETRSSLELCNEASINQTSADLIKSHVSTEDNNSDIKSFTSKEEATDECENRQQTKKEDSNDNRETTDMNKGHQTEVSYSVQTSENEADFNAVETDSLEDYKDRSPGNSKRSRTSSLTSESESVCKRCKSQIRSVRITCKDPNEVLNTDVIRKVQSVISESIDIIIDNVDFLPRLECHGIKNGGLIYSCHDDKTFAWLTNFVVSDLDLDVMETDYPSKTYLEIKIYSFEDVDKILNRIKLYNPELDTSSWRVVDKKEFEDYVIITVEIDKESFDIVNKNNYSFFAGTDKAKFNIVWS